MVVHVVPSETEPASGAGNREALDSIKGAFLASLNHEVRTPLSGIMGMLDLLSETPLDEDQRDYLNAARLCTESLAELLNAALQYSALEAGQFALDEGEFSVREALEAALALYQAKAEMKKLKMSLTLDAGLPETMIGDAPRIRELLGHLLANAVKFTHRGSVSVDALLEVQALENDTQVPFLVLVVRDTGIGIPEDRLNTIFDSFHQGQGGMSRTYPGLGLGLALASKLTLALGGRIQVESKVDVGSTFTVRIPLRRPMEAAAVSSTRSPAILAVDDNPIGLRVLRHVLERRRVRVVCAASGREAIAAVKKQSFDLIFMDLQMPDIDGITACREIRKLPGGEEVPIVALTANYSDQVRDLCRANGMQAFLSKPVDATELWSAVTRYVPCAAPQDPAH